MSLLPSTPPEEDTLHWYAINYRTALTVGASALAWLDLEAYVQRKIKEAEIAERERCIRISEDHGAAAPQAPRKPWEGYTDGYSDAANEIMWAIREKPTNGAPNS